MKCTETQTEETKQSTGKRSESTGEKGRSCQPAAHFVFLA